MKQKIDWNNNFKYTGKFKYYVEDRSHRFCDSLLKFVFKDKC